MDSIDRAIHRILKRPHAGRLIRSYGVAEFTRCLRWNIWSGGREAIIYIKSFETPQIAALMAEALATARF